MPRKKKPKAKTKPKPKPKPEPKPSSCNGRCKPKPKPKPKPRPARQEPPPKMILRNNSPQARAEADTTGDTEGRTPIVQRVSNMGGSHLLAGVAGGVAAQAGAVLGVGKALVGPKTAAGIMLGAGSATTATGWYFEKDHVMAAGIGVTAAGAVSMTNQLAADAYDAIEKRAEEKRKKKAETEAEKAHAKKLAEARALLEAENKKHRNARRIDIVAPTDDSHGRNYPDDDDHTAA